MAIPVDCCHCNTSPTRKRLGFAARVANAFGALFGDYTPSKAGDVPVSIRLDTSKFESEMKRVKARLAELAPLLEREPRPAPQLLIRVARDPGQEVTKRIADEIEDALDYEKPIVLTPGIEAWQLVDGEWKPIESTHDGVSKLLDDAFREARIKALRDMAKKGLQPSSSDFIAVRAIKRPTKAETPHADGQEAPDEAGDGQAVS